MCDSDLCCRVLNEYKLTNTRICMVWKLHINVNEEVKSFCIDMKINKRVNKKNENEQGWNYDKYVDGDYISSSWY